MSMEKIRREMDDPFDYNQKVSKAIVDHQNKLKGGNLSKKAQRAIERRGKEDKFVRDWITRQSEFNLSSKDRLGLALRRKTPEDLLLITENPGDLEQFGYTVTTYTFSVGKKETLEQDPKA